MTLPDQLKQAIAAAHAAIEETAAAKAMIGGTIDRGAYAWLLGQLGRLHAGLEKALAGRPELAGLYRPADMDRGSIIAGDLAALGADPADESNDAVTALIMQYRRWAEQSPWMLVGALYVVEGSRMGSMALVRPVAKALGVDVRPGTGVDYHLDGMASRPQAWQGFRAALAATPFSDAQKENICRAAVATMLGLHGLYAAAPAGVPAGV